MSSFETIEASVRRLDNRVGSVSLNAGTLRVTSTGGTVTLSGTVPVSNYALDNALGAMRSATACNFATFSWNGDGTPGTIVYMASSGGAVLGSLVFVYSGGTLQTITRV